jgi:hypothetical protein
MKRGWWIVALALIAIVAVIAAISQRLLSREASIRHHTEGWHKAISAAAKGSIPIPFPQRLYRFQSPGDYWWSRANEHERELFRLGYLTRLELRLTNQTVTPELSKAFNQRVLEQIGRDRSQVWSVGGLPDKAGLRITARVQDTSLWQRIFYECAALHASNLPPAREKQ